MHDEDVADYNKRLPIYRPDHWGPEEKEDWSRLHSLILPFLIFAVILDVALIIYLCM